MYIKLRSQECNRIIYNCEMPQNIVGQKYQHSIKLKKSPQKNYDEKVLHTYKSKTNQDKIMKTINLTLEMQNYNIIYKRPLLNNFNFSEEVSFIYKKPPKLAKRYSPQSKKVQEKTFDSILVGQNFKRLSERLNETHRTKSITQPKQHSKSKVTSNNIQIEPKGWTNQSSHSLL